MTDEETIRLAGVLLGGVMLAIPDDVHFSGSFLCRASGNPLSRENLCDIAEAAVKARDEFRKGIKS
jgi:hypothetical protein